jgi:hypothetical protein
VEYSAKGRPMRDAARQSHTGPEQDLRRGRWNDDEVRFDH